jgi:hypothetical protein
MLKNILTLNFASCWRTYAAMGAFVGACALEWIGVDVPEFTAPGVTEAAMIVLTALGIYERAKSGPAV